MGVEDATHHECDGEEGPAQGDDGDGLADDSACLLGAAAEDHADGPGKDDEGYSAEDGGDRGGTQAGRECGGYRGMVVVLRGSRHAVEEHRGDGEADDAVGQGVEHRRVIQGLHAGNLHTHGQEVLAGADNTGRYLSQVEEGQVGDDAGGQRPPG